MSVIFDGRTYREMTAEEIVARQTEVTKASLMERTRLLTTDEVYRMIITQQINTLEVDDNTALRMKEFYPAFESIVGQTVNSGFKFTYGDKLWKVIQPSLTIQEHYPPGEGMESLYTEVNETHAGTLEDPIPYSGNMALVKDLYYMQDYIIYLCTNDTVNPVYHPLSELVGLYVETT